MHDFVRVFGGALVGLNFRLKEADRFKEKLAKMILDRPDRSVGALADSIHDGIRYTMTFETATYKQRVQEVCRRLSEAGCQRVILKNSWGSDQYKGINSRWRDPASGQFFELQFHTPESWAAKQQTHDMYQRLEDPRTSAIERKELRDWQRKISSRIPIPPGWEGI